MQNNRANFSCILLFFMLLSSCGQGLNNGAYLSSDDKPQPVKTYGVIGDSAAAGALASTSVGNLNDFASVLGKNLDASSKAAIDSIRKGRFNTDKFVLNIEKRGSDSKLSALLTSRDWGLRQELAKTADNKMPAVMHAVKWGLHYSGFEKKHEELLKQYRKHTKSQPADVLAVMLGGNDYCSGASPESFEKNVKRALELIVASHPNSTVLIAPVPHMSNLADVDHTYEQHYKLTKKIAGRKINIIDTTVKFVTCKALQKTLCKNLSNDDSKDVWEEYNAILNEQVANFSENFDGKIKIADGIADLKPGRKDLAVDCFHPSEKGQRKFAEAFIDAFQATRK